MPLLEKIKIKLSTIFTGSNFLINTTQLISGTVLAQIIIISTAPIITRLFSPNDLGIFAIFTAIVAILGSLSTLRYEIAIPLENSEKKSSSIFLLTVIVNIIFTIICSIFIYFYSGIFLKLLNIEGLQAYVWTIPIAIFLGGLIKTFTYWALKNDAFNVLAMTRIQQGFGMSISQIFLGLYYSAGPLSLIFGYLLGFIFGLRRLVSFWISSGLAKLRSASFLSIARQAKKHKDLPLFSNWGSLINVIGLQLPVIFFASLFSPYMAGLYMLAQRVANAPVQLIAESTGKAFYITSIKKLKDDSATPFINTTIKFLLRISVLPFIVLVILAPQLFSIVFGDEWLESGIYLQYMAIWLLSSFVFVPIMTLFAALNKHRADLIFQISLVGVRLIGITIGWLYSDPILAIAVFSILSATVYVIFGMWLINISGTKISTQLNIFFNEFKIPVVIGFSLLIFRYLFIGAGFISSNTTEFIIFFLICVLITIAYLFRSRNLFIELKKHTS